MVQRLNSLALAAGVAIAIAAAPAISQAQDKIKLVYAATYTDNLPTTPILKVDWYNALKKYSDNRIEVDFQFDGKLCVEHKCVEQARLGLVDMGASSSGNIGAFGKVFDIDFLPYIFKDENTAYKYHLDWYGKMLRENSQKEMGLYTFGTLMSLGYRQLQNKVREVRVPADLKGIKIRTTKSPVEVELIKAWGGIATPYDWGQLYEGLSSGVVEGMFIALGWVGVMRFDDITKFNTVVDGSNTMLVQFMDLKRYKGLPAWAQEAIEKAGWDLQRDHYAKDLEGRKLLEKRVYENAKVYTPTEAEMKLWRASAPAAWKALEGRYDKAVAKRLLTEQGSTDFMQVLEAQKLL